MTKLMHELLDDFVCQGQAAVPAGRRLGKVAVEVLPAGKAILKLERETQADLAIEVLLRLAATIRRGTATADDHNYRQLHKILAQALFRKKLSFDHPGILRLAEAATTFKKHYLWQMPVGLVIGQFESYVERNQLPADLRSALTPLAETVRDLVRLESPDQRKLLHRLEDLLAEVKEDDSPLPAPGEAWADSLLAWLSALPASAASSWHHLLAHCRRATSAQPPEKWLRTAEEIVEKIGTEEFRLLAGRILSRIGEPRSRPPRDDPHAEPTLIGEADSDLLRGLVWMAGRVADRELAAALGQAAETCFKKVEGIGPRSLKIGNACLQALAQAQEPSAVARISRLKARARHASVRDRIDQTLGELARRQGVTVDEIEERGVPDFGLQEVGIRRLTLGGFTVEILANGPGDVALRWLRADGSVQKSVPAAVKAEHPDDLKSIQRAAKEIASLLAGQRDRIERLFLISRDWDLSTWRERYLDHSLVGILARRLIWRFRREGTDQLGLWREGEIVDSAGSPLTGLDDTTRVSLWHPLESPPETVRAWRTSLEQNQVTQPFKQAHREIYILTDAELQTATYSNRFAAHILKQHQFVALCRQRGWQYRLQGAWDSDDTPFRLVPEHDLRVEFWVDPPEDYDDDLSENNIFLNISTDQVRFCDLAGVPRPLDQVSPLLFSELMRDIDLFVGVTSIGNDPNWVDGNRTDADYWQHYSFGDLSASAQIRRDVLERLVPRLKIAGRCTLTDRFLVVRGDLRTYRIHLGSGNILMEPNDQYLCIVRDSQPSRNAETMVLPFEGDTTLSLILSKAFLLADDARITDTTILRQIRQGETR